MQLALLTPSSQPFSKYFQILDLETLEEVSASYEEVWTRVDWEEETI